MNICLYPVSNKSNKSKYNRVVVRMKASHATQKTLRNRRRIRFGNPALIQNSDKLVMNGLGTTQLVLDENESMMKRRSRKQ
tara:strand:+ start:137 stop:379 length:243 start_codon:yes stop_codon:yes gene_type:complete